MTKTQTPCSVNHSVSPSAKSSAVPLFGTDAIPRELQGDHEEKEAAPGQSTPRSSATGARGRGAFLMSDVSIWVYVIYEERPVRYTR